MRFTVYFVDAFTTKLFKGNPAAVVLLDDWLSDDTMQKMASEHNLSETVFAVEQDNVWHLRWFSPKTEIDFCGHATLACAFIVFRLNPGAMLFRGHANAIGQFTVKQQPDGRMSMDFPVMPSDVVDEIPSALLNGLSKPPTFVLKTKQAFMAIFDSESDVRELSVNTSLLQQLAPLDVVVTAPGENVDFVSRYFWPSNGGDEDAVTGSIHTALTPYWSKRLRKNPLKAHQASLRGGDLWCEMAESRVIISGEAILYMQGEVSLGTDEIP